MISNNLNYNTPNPVSTGDTYIPGKSIPQDDSSSKSMNQMSFTKIRSTLLHNLQKEYNYLYPRYLDAYKRWKSNSLDSNTNDAQSAESDYNNLGLQLKAIINAITNLNEKTYNDIVHSSRILEDQDKQIFKNAQIIKNEKSNLTDLSDRLASGEDKMRDYQIMNRNWGHRLLFWFIVAIVVFVIWLGMMTKFYGIKLPQRT